jgi:hypothetical protein
MSRSSKLVWIILLALFVSSFAFLALAYGDVTYCLPEYGCNPNDSVNWTWGTTSDQSRTYRPSYAVLMVGNEWAQLSPACSDSAWMGYKVIWSDPDNDLLPEEAELEKTDHAVALTGLIKMRSDQQEIVGCRIPDVTATPTETTLTPQPTVQPTPTPTAVVSPTPTPARFTVYMPSLDSNFYP